MQVTGKPGYNIDSCIGPGDRSPLVGPGRATSHNGGVTLGVPVALACKTVTPKICSMDLWEKGQLNVARKSLGSWRC